MLIILRIVSDIVGQLEWITDRHPEGAPEKLKVIHLVLLHICYLR